MFAASDFVFEQSLRDPLMLLDLADSGELERSLAAGELRAQLQEAVDACGDEDELGRCLRRLRNRQQTRIIWRDVCRLTDLREFAKLGDHIARAKDKVDQASRTLDETGVRSRAISRHLRDVEALPEGDVQHALVTRSLFDADDAAAPPDTR